MIAIGVIVVVVVLIVMTVYTDLGMPPMPAQDHAFHIELRQLPPRPDANPR